MSKSLAGCLRGASLELQEVGLAVAKYQLTTTRLMGTNTSTRDLQQGLKLQQRWTGGLAWLTQAGHLTLGWLWEASCGGSSSQEGGNLMASEV